MCVDVGICVRGQNRLLHVLHSSPYTRCIGCPTGWYVPSPCVQWSKTTCSSAYFTPTSNTSGMYVCCTCVCVGGGEVCMGVYLNKTDIVFHSPPNCRCRFPHKLVSPLPMCSWELVNLAISFHPLHSQYRWHHLDLNKHRSVCWGRRWG